MERLVCSQKIKAYFRICVVSLMLIDAVALAANKTAPQSWTVPCVPAIVSTNILYLPISSQAIKQIASKDIKEELVDLLKVNHPRMKPLSTFNKQYTNTYEGYSKVRYGLYQKLILMLDKLPKDIGIAYFEGFRPLAKQKEYFDKKLKETLINIPDKNLAYEETSKLVSPFINNIPTHCTGAAIDLTLFRVIDGKAELLDMGQFDVIFGENPQQETFSNNTTPLQRKNRLLLLKVAAESGLVNYGWEWWHYSFGDRAWAYVKGEKYAKYGLAADKEDPILHMDKQSYLNQF